MRREPTPPEQKLWFVLRRCQLDGLKFRRQVPIGPFIADFYCPPARLVVEVDGAAHSDSTTDATRDAWMLDQGLRVLRVWNNDVMGNLEGVLAVIRHAAREPLPPAPPARGGGDRSARQMPRWPRARFGVSPRVMDRTASLTRTTSETDIALSLALDGTGKAEIATGIGFLDHMLTALARHSLIDLTVRATGDLHIDFHHTTEDVGIVLGRAVAKALGEKRGIRRFGQALVPMDEALAEVAIDISGRPFLAWDVAFERPKVGEMDTELFEEFFRAFAANALLTLHVTRRAGHNAHHVAEACFKATARALRIAVEPDPRGGDAVPSTKGSL